MKCMNCGAELAEDSKFCGVCGTTVTVEETVAEVPTADPVVEAPVEETPAVETAEVVQPKQEKGPSKVKLAVAALAVKVQPLVEKCKPFVQKNKLWFAGGACLAILLITVLVIVAACNNGNGYTPFEHAISAFVDDGEIMVQYDNKKVIKTGIEAKSISKRQLSMDGNVLAFLTDDAQLVVVKGKKASVVAEDVTEFSLSVSGKGIGFVTENEDGEATLKLLTVGKKNAKTALENYTYFGYELSPDGKSMACFKYDEDDDARVLMYFNGSKTTKVTSSDVDLIGLSNKGKQIYVVGENDEGKDVLFSYNTKGDKKKIGECADMIFAFNEDHTQILFFNGNMSWDEGMEVRTYVSTKGKEAVKISSSFATPLVPNSSMTLERGGAATFPTDDLYNKVYSCYKEGQTNLWLIKKNVDNSKKLVSNVSGAVLDESAKYVYYGDKDDDLKMLKISHGDRASDKAKLIAEDVENFVVTSDRSKVYFISEDSLYSVNGKNGKGKKTVANEDVGDTLVLNQKDICYYFVDGDVYASSNGRKGKLVVAEADELDATPNGIVYIETDDATYATKTAKKPKKTYTND